jgi:hypothetical protein
VGRSADNGSEALNPPDAVSKTDVEQNSFGSNGFAMRSGVEAKEQGRSVDLVMA